MVSSRMERNSYLSLSNLFWQSEKISAKEIFEKARAEKIFVRYFNKPRIDNYLRVTIGTDDEMKAFLELLKKIV